MKKASKLMNNKGFMMAELVVVGMFVLSLFTFLFVNLAPLIEEYNIQKEHDTISGVYNANLIRTMLLSDDYGDILTDGLTTGINDLSYKEYTPDAFCDIMTKKMSTATAEDETLKNARKNYCLMLLGEDYISVKKIYVTFYRSDGIKADLPKMTDQGLIYYVKNMDDYNQPSGRVYDNYRRLIIAYNDGSYANIEIRKSK